MKTKKKKLTILEIINKIIDSDLPLSTRNSIVRHYMLPQLGMTQSIVESDKVDIQFVDRPDAEEVFLEENPKIKAGDKATEELMTGKDDD